MGSNALAPLWQIDQDLMTLVDSLEGCPDELRPELEQRITEYMAREAAKVDRVAAVIASLEHVQENAKSEIDRLRDRQRIAANAQERLEKYVLKIIHERGGRPIKGNNVTLQVRPSEALVITDPDLIPAGFRRINYDIPKTPIKEAIKRGEAVPGAVIETHEHLVRK